MFILGHEALSVENYLFSEFPILYSDTAFAVCLSYTPVGITLILTNSDLVKRFCRITTSFPKENISKSVQQFVVKIFVELELQYCLLSH